MEFGHPEIPAQCESVHDEPRPSDDSARRKNAPLARGVLFYFPDALQAMAELSKKGNDKHNPGEELHWSRDKSTDHADCILRHLKDAGADWIAIDPEDSVLHAVKVAWRACALAQIAIERTRGGSKPPKDDDWRKWTGGPCPVAKGTRVTVRFANGDECSSYAAGAWQWEWEYAGLDCDIVAYKVLEQR